MHVGSKDFTAYDDSKQCCDEDEKLDAISTLVDKFRNKINQQAQEDKRGTVGNMFSFISLEPSANNVEWITDNYQRFLKDTPNEVIATTTHLTEMGFITALEYSPDGTHIVCGYSTGLIQVLHGHTGLVLAKLKSIQFPPKPVYALHYVKSGEDEAGAKVCYAACADGAVYKLTIPYLVLDTSFQSSSIPQHYIKADPTLHNLTVKHQTAPTTSHHATPMFVYRHPAMAMGITADKQTMVVGYTDAAIKTYDMETQKQINNYKMQKVRLQFVPKKLQRMHIQRVCALRTHHRDRTVFASAGWDQTLRIWDTRVEIGCMLTFGGVDVCTNSIDLNRDYCLVGSWKPTEALTLWDLRAQKRHSIIAVQNRRSDIDGEYICACRYWKSSEFNRKGKYGIIGGSGTECVEVINLHNRYIACSYPAPGAVLAITSYQERIAFGGTSPYFSIVTFHDPKHEPYHVPKAPESEDTSAVQGEMMDEHILFDNQSFLRNYSVEKVIEM